MVAIMPKLPASVDPPLLFCPRCGEPRLEGMKFCGRCRFDFNDVRPEADPVGTTAAPIHSAPTSTDRTPQPVVGMSSGGAFPSNAGLQAATESTRPLAGSKYRLRAAAVVIGAIALIGIAVGGFGRGTASSRTQYEAFVSKVNALVDRERQIVSSLGLAPTITEFGDSAREIGSLAEGMVSWLDANPPANCYAEAWKATRREALELRSLNQHLQAFASSPSLESQTAIQAELDASQNVAQDAIVLTQDADASCR